MISINFTKMCSECEYSSMEFIKNKWNKQEGIVLMCSCEKILSKETTKIVCAIARLDENLCGRDGKYWKNKNINEEKS